MDESQKQSKKRFFHVEPVLVPVSDCYDFIMYPNGLMSAFKGHRSAGNEKIILYFLTRHMSQETPEGETSEFKDIAQTFWGKQDYIAAKTGLTQNRISEAINNLVEGGILINHVERGVGQRVAFSSEVISYWVDFSQDRAIQRVSRISGKRMQANPVSGSDNIRLPDAGKSGKRMQANPVSGCGPFIEEKGIGSREPDLGNSPSGWMEEQKPNQKPQPATGRDKRVALLVEQSKRIERALKPGKYVDFDETNLFMAGKLDRFGQHILDAFVRWVQENACHFNWKRGADWARCLEYVWEEFDQSTRGVQAGDLS